MPNADRPNVLAVRAVSERLENISDPIEPPGAFPMEVFPPDIRAYIAASAESARIPTAMVAVPFLAFAGAIIGNQLCVDIGNGWTEYPALWVALVAITGAGKTPGISWARLPLDCLQEEAWRKWKKKKKPLELFFATDTTIESLAQDLSCSPGLVIVRDELYGLLKTMSQFQAGSSRVTQPFLSIWSSQPLAMSRRNMGHVYVRTPVVGICGGIQPHLWNHFTARQMDGMIERFIPVVFGLPRDYWNESLAVDSTPPDVSVMIERFRRLRSIAPRSLTVSCTPEAGLVWAKWFNGNLDRSLAASILHIGYYQKLPSQVARTALILHALWHPDQPDYSISADTMGFATSLGEFYRTHIHRSLAFLGQPRKAPVPQPTLGERILRLLGEHTESEGWMTRADLHAAIGKPARAMFTEILGSLVEGSFLDRRKQRLPHSKRPVESYRLSRRGA